MKTSHRSGIYPEAEINHQTQGLLASLSGGSLWQERLVFVVASLTEDMFTFDVDFNRPDTNALGLHPTMGNSSILKGADLTWPTSLVPRRRRNSPASDSFVAPALLPSGLFAYLQTNVSKLTLSLPDSRRLGARDAHLSLGRRGFCLERRAMRRARR